MQDQQLYISQSVTGDNLPVLKVAGVLNAYNFEQLERAFNTFFQDGTYTFAVDVSELTYLSSAGVGVFVGAAGRAQAGGGMIAVAAPCEEVKKILDLLGVNHIFPVSPTLEEAARVLRETSL